MHMILAAILNRYDAHFGPPNSPTNQWMKMATKLNTSRQGRMTTPNQLVKSTTVSTSDINSLVRTVLAEVIFLSGCQTMGVDFRIGVFAGVRMAWQCWSASAKVWRSAPVGGCPR